MSEETIIAVYDTAAHAEDAVRDLHAANVPAGAISQHAGTGTGSGLMAGSAQTSAPGREPGFWNRLFGGEPDHDTSVYDRSMDGGSTVVTVRVPDEHVESVSRILELHNPIDLDQRATGYGIGATTATTMGTQAASTQATTATAAPAMGATAPEAGDQVIALSEEQLVVGKRLVNRGSTRVRRYVVETPVEENVTLRSERVSIERRPVAAGTRTADTEFTDRVIEVTETAEEAVVGKSAHVREEVVIRKDAAEHVETVHDTIRREDVEVERVPVQTTTTTTTTTDTIAPMTPARDGTPKI